MTLRRRAPLLWLTSGALCAGFAAIAIVPAGCTGEACSVDPLHPKQAITTIECPAGLLCYQGQCIHGCNAGQGGSNACPEGLTCVPTLNICRRVEEVERPKKPLRPDSISGPYPLDEIFEPDGLTERMPEPPEPPERTPYSHALFLEAAQVVDIMSSPVSIGSVRIESWDVSQTGVVGLRWRSEFSPPRVNAESPIDVLTQPNSCVVRRLETSGNAATIVPADIGQILIETHPGFRRGATVNLKANFDPGTSRYSLDMPVPASYLQFSLYPFDASYLAVTGPGLPGITDGGWPDFYDLPDNAHHVPFELELTLDSEQKLRDGFDVGAAPADLALSFLPYNPANPTSGSVPGESIVFTVIAGDVELRCDLKEGTNGDTTLFVHGPILSSFRAAVGSPGTFPASFERVCAYRPPIDPSSDPAAKKAIDLVVQVSHKYRSVMRLQ